MSTFFRSMSHSIPSLIIPPGQPGVKRKFEAQMPAGAGKYFALEVGFGRTRT